MIDVELRNISKRYPSPGGGPDTDVLRGLDLHVPAGGCVAIVGPSGSGKSTLLNLIGALDRPTSGTVRLGEKQLDAMKDSGLAAVRNTTLGMVFQLHHLLGQCTVLENVLLPTLATRKRDADAPARARKLIDRVGLTDQIDHRPGELSGGQRLRAAVARALINQPQVLLADEPTGSLDQETAETIIDLLVELNESDGLTLIAVTHSQHLAARMQRTLHLAGGRLKDA